MPAPAGTTYALDRWVGGIDPADGTPCWFTPTGTLASIDLRGESGGWGFFAFRDGFNPETTKHTKPEEALESGLNSKLADPTAHVEYRHPDTPTVIELE